jgi:hypothetical protein
LGAGPRHQRDRQRLRSRLYLNGVLLNVLYQGSSVYPGVDVIIFTIPSSAPDSCYVPLVAVTGTVVSNVVILPIHQGGGTCVVQGTGGVTVTGDQILKNTQDTLKAGSLSVIQTNVTNAKGILTVTNTAGAAFFKDSGLLAGATGRGDNLAPGGCAVYPIITGGQVTVAGLDAGSITFTGPTGTAIPLPIQLGIKSEYGATLAAGGIPSSGGTFTFTGSGGADVGQFTSTLTMSNPLFNWTNQSAAATNRPDAGITVYLDRRLAGDLRPPRRNLDGVGSDCGLFLPGTGGSPAVYRALLYSARHAGRERRCLDTTA